MFLSDLRKMPPSKRMDYVRENEDKLRTMTPRHLEDVGTLLCQASTKEMREEFPIQGDVNREKQTIFENSQTSGEPAE